MKGKCSDCGFDNIIKRQLLDKCKALTPYTDFEYSEFSKIPRYEKPPDAVKRANTSSAAAHKAVRALAGCHSAGFAKLQTACIKAIKKAETDAHLALCIVEGEQAKSVVALKEASQLATLHARCKALLDVARKCGQAMARTSDQKSNNEDLLSVELKPLYPEGAQKRGAYLETKKKGSVPFLLYMASTHYNFMMHELVRRWQEKQKKKMEEQLRPGEVHLQTDFSAKAAMVQRWWTSEDSKKKKEHFNPRHHCRMEG